MRLRFYLCLKLLICFAAAVCVEQRPAQSQNSPVASSTAEPSRSYSILTLDLSVETDRQVTVDRDKGQYLGHPTTLLLEDGKSMLCVYPMGHGRGEIVYRRSADGGRTWSDRLPTPDSWATSQEVPTLHRVVDANGKQRIVLWSGLHPARLAVSDDDGATWSDLQTVGDWGGIVVMGFVEKLSTPGHYLAMFHDDGRFLSPDGKCADPVLFKVLKTFSRDGGLTWSRPAVVTQSSEVHLCEPGCIRSPDGKQLAVLLRENSRRKNSHVIFSDDEGKTWSAPRSLPAALTGDRHTGKYTSDGRLFISFRDTTLESPTKGDWVAWVGTYEDIVEGREGEYRVRLMDNHVKADCGYAGVEVLADDTIVTTSYGHWTPGEEPYIVSVRLKPGELDQRAAALSHAEKLRPFGDQFPDLDSYATRGWWQPKGDAPAKLLVPRDQVVAFALYTHQNGILKLSTQLYPLLPDETREVRLEFMRDGQWQEVKRESAQERGWSAHFRIDGWDNSHDVRFRVRHGELAEFEGTIRRDPIGKDPIVVGALSCNSNATTGPRASIVENLKRQNPDLLFFAGDQSYYHQQHTFGWLEFGIQFRDILKDRPVITIPDDHDIGQGNVWGAYGKKAETPNGNDGGYFYPADYVNMVQRCQTWHLPDPADPNPVVRGIGLYYTSLELGGIDFAIIEDRKFKSGPKGNIPQMGPRPDHINDPSYDPKSIDLPGLELLGHRQLAFLRGWGQKNRATMKCVLSQTAFVGAVHIHGDPDNRLLADLDCNGWPQAGRRRALEAIRDANAVHVCGDQHLATLVKHGIDAFDDGPYGFTVPAIVNSYYGRWWHPENEQPGENPVEGTALAWTGNYRDGLGNPFRMLAYANPGDPDDPKKRGDGYGIVRFRKSARTVTFECWPRFVNLTDGDSAQYTGWPRTVALELQ